MFLFGLWGFLGVFFGCLCPLLFLLILLCLVVDFPLLSPSSSGHLCSPAETHKDHCTGEIPVYVTAYITGIDSLSLLRQSGQCLGVAGWRGVLCS